MTAPTSRDSDKFMLRLPEGMRARIRATAEANGRSMNSEIVHRLAISFGADDLLALPAAEPPTDLDQVMNLLDRARDNLVRLAQQQEEK